MKKRMFVYLLLAFALVIALFGVGCRGREQPTAPVQPAPVQQPSGQQQPASAKPDLVVSQATVSSTGNPGEVRIHIVSNNRGGPISAAFTVRWHPHEKDKTQVGCSQDFYDLNQTEWIVDCTYAYPVNIWGDMHWVAAVDAENDVKNESNENNNEMKGTINIPKAGAQPSGGQQPSGGEQPSGGNQPSGGQQPSGGDQPSGGQANQTPAVPSNLRVTATTKTTARLAWNDTSNNEDGFEIDFPGKQNPKAGANETQWEITGLKCASAYNFKVRAFNAAGNSAYSNEVTAQTLACDGGGNNAPSAPAAPSDLTMVSWTKDSVTVTWHDNSNNEEGFEIDIPGLKNVTADPNATQYEVTGLKCGQTYSLRVRAFNATGNSAYSNAVTMQTTACSGGGNAAPLVITSIAAAIGPANYAGPCPYRVDYSGSITVSGGPGTVKYLWILDGQAHPTRELGFDGPGTKSVETGNWSVNGGTHTAQLKTIEPSEQWKQDSINVECSN